MANERDKQMQTGETGGAATHKGIWYQALWCLLQAASAQVECRGADSLRLVLEPFGGDTWLVRPGHRRVVQLKTVYRGTWSLKEVVEQVFPDLYRSVELDSSENVTYEFVTEGRMGSWATVLSSFESMGTHLPRAASEETFKASYEALDDQRELRFGGSSQAFWGGARTQRRIFDCIVEHLHGQELNHGQNAPPLEETRRKCWQLLSRFRFVPEVREECVRRELDRELLKVVERRERLESVRNAMVADLIRRSREGRAVVRPAELFCSQNLCGVTPVGYDAVLNDRCRTQLQRAAERLGYRQEWDVRQLGASLPCDQVTAPAITVITGASGHGKTWRLCAQALQSELPATVLLRSAGRVHDDLQRAADEVWRGSLGHEEPVDLRSISARRADVLKTQQRAPWLAIALDQFSGSVEANLLLDEAIEDWGVRVIVACDEDAAAVFEQYRRVQPDRVQVQRVGLFSISERDNYLQRRLGDSWVEIPPDVRQLIRSPQLAGLYCDTLSDRKHWEPRNEYELVAAYWGRLTAHADYRRDELRLQSLAATILKNARYPWDEEQLESAGVEQQAARRIAGAGWLRLNSDRLYEVPHERLLNFAVAKHLAARHRSGAMADSQVAELLSSMLTDGDRFSGLRLGYVPMDWFFLRSRDLEGGTLRVWRDIRNRIDYRAREVLHRHLLPTLGAAALPLLWDSLVALVGADGHWELAPVLDGLATEPTDALRPLVLELLLQNSAPLLQRAALRVLARRPIPEALDLVWKLHTRMQRHPAEFLTKDELPRGNQRISAFHLYEEAFDALRECARISPEWVAHAISISDPNVEPTHDLAYLAANLNDDGRTWHRCKKDLFEKVSTDKRRCLALNAGIWRDPSDADWLARVVDIEQDSLGPAALRALAEIDPRRAVATLHQASDNIVYLCRNWFLPRLFARFPEETNADLRRRILSAPNRLRAALIYSDCENDIDLETFNVLLESLDTELKQLLEEAKQVGAAAVRDKCNGLSLSLNLLLKMGRSDLLSALSSRHSSPLEMRLADLLIDVLGPRHTLGPDNLARKPALELLRRMGGPEHQRVVSTFLDAESQYGKLDAIQHAFADPTADTLGKLCRVATSDASWDGHPLLQMECMRALAAAGDALGLVEAAMHLGLHIPADLEEWLRPELAHREQAIECATAALRERSVDKLPGALDILGVLRHTAAADEMIQILTDPPSEDALLAAIIGLGRTGEAANPAVKLIAAQLESERRRYASHNALLRIGTVDARQALLESLNQVWDAQVAILLSEFQDTRAAAINALLDRLEDGRSPRAVRWPGDAELVLGMATEDTLRDILRRCPGLTDRVRETALGLEGGLWIVGSKADAIRALTLIDPHTAQLAATKALSDRSSRDRHLYAPQLIRLDPIKARETFLDLVESERNAAVRWSMAYSLQRSDTSWLSDQLVSNSSTVRLAACRLCDSLVLSDETLSDKVARLLEDSSHRVRDAAEETIGHWRRGKWTRALVTQLNDPGNCTRRSWAIIDALIAVADGGYKGTCYPQWVRDCLESCALRKCPALRKILAKRIEERRKKAVEEAEREAERSR